MYNELEKAKFKRFKQEYMGKPRAIWACVQHHPEGDEIIKVTTQGLAMKWQSEDWQNRSCFNINYMQILVENSKGIYYNA